MDYKSIIYAGKSKEIHIRKSERERECWILHINPAHTFEVHMFGADSKQPK